MAVRQEAKVVDLMQLDDLLQCPVCYEVPNAHIYQCNQGHHVCGPCKARISVCPVCRCLFFGTRNYAMEELIANIRKMRLSTPPVSNAPPAIHTDENHSANSTNTSTQNTPSTSASEGRPPAPVSSRGLFRCLCCKNGDTQRLPMARLLNHLRYFHRSDLVEGKMENDKYEQSWQVSTEKHREVIAFRIAEMGIFFLVVEIAEEELSGWLSMAASHEEANKFCFQLTITGADREACYSDNVKSTRACEGHIKKRLRCLSVTGENLSSFYQHSAVVSRVCISRISQGVDDVEPRTALRIANLPSNRIITDLVNQRAHSPRAPTPAQRSVVRPAPSQRQQSTNSAVATLLQQAQPRFVSLLRQTALHMEQQLQQAPSSTTTQHSNVPRRESHTHTAGGQQLSRNARRRMRQQIRQGVEASVHSNGLNVQHHTSARAAAPNQNVGRAPTSNTSRASAPTANSNRAQASNGGTQSTPVSANMRQAANRATANNSILQASVSVPIMGRTSHRRPNSTGVLLNLTAPSVNINQAQLQGNSNRPDSAPAVNRNRRVVDPNQLHFDAVTRPEAVTRGRGRRSRR